MEANFCHTHSFFFFFLQISGMQMDLLQLIWVVLCNFTTYIDDFTFLSLSTYIDIYILWYISNLSVNHSVLSFLSKFGGCQFLQPRFLSVADLPVSRNADPACGLGKCGNWLCCCVWVCSFCPLCWTYPHSPQVRVYGCFARIQSTTFPSNWCLFQEWTQ